MLAALVRKDIWGGWVRGLTGRGGESNLQSGDDGGLEQKAVTTQRGQKMQDNKDMGRAPVDLETPAGQGGGGMWVIFFLNFPFPALVHVVLLKN